MYQLTALHGIAMGLPSCIFCCEKAELLLQNRSLRALWRMLVLERPCRVLLSFLEAALCSSILLQSFHASAFVFSLDLSSSPPGPYGQEMYVYRPEERFKSPPILPPHLLQVILNKDTNISVCTSILPTERDTLGSERLPVCRKPGLPLAGV